ncbi:MAG: iron uptake porin [Waterburya sp.]
MSAPVILASELTTSVHQLQDVQPTDWAFTALQSLMERYGIIQGYPDGLFKGDRSLTRSKFAAALNRVLAEIEQGTVNNLSQTDLATIRKLQVNFAAELTSLQKRLTTLEKNTQALEDTQFSTTTKLKGQAIFAVSAGGFTGDRVIAPTGSVVTTEQPNATLLYRSSLDLDTSFVGTDLLKVRLVTGSDGGSDNVAGFLEPNFGSVLDFSLAGRDGEFSVARLYYSFTPVEELKVTLASLMVATEYVDRNSYANSSVKDFSTQALTNNFILFPRGRGSGAVVEWNPSNVPLRVTALYIAGNAASNQESDRVIEGSSAPILLFPNRGGAGGLFDDPYQGMVEAEYTPRENITLRLQYSGGKVFESPFDAVGINGEWAITPKLGIFARYGWSNYDNTFQGDISPNYWQTGIAFRDLFKTGASSGIAIAQPFVEDQIGNATQTNLEAFYNLPLQDNITLTPLIQVVINPGNQNDSSTMITGALRTVFSF